MTSKAARLAEEIRNPYMGFGAQCNQIAAMLTVQDRLLQEVHHMLQHTAFPAELRERARVLSKAITDNNYPEGSVLDIRPVLEALKSLESC